MGGCSTKSKHTARTTKRTLSTIREPANWHFVPVVRAALEGLCCREACSVENYIRENSNGRILQKDFDEGDGTVDEIVEFVYQFD